MQVRAIIATFISKEHRVARINYFLRSEEMVQYGKPFAVQM